MGDTCCILARILDAYFRLPFGSFLLPFLALYRAFYPPRFSAAPLTHRYTKLENLGVFQR